MSEHEDIGRSFLAGTNIDPDDAPSRLGPFEIESRLAKGFTVVAQTAQPATALIRVQGRHREQRLSVTVGEIELTGTTVVWQNFEPFWDWIVFDIIETDQRILTVTFRIF